jgi:hypothetical protein
LGGTSRREEASLVKLEAKEVAAIADVLRRDRWGGLFATAAGDYGWQYNCHTNRSI